ncbi:uncharacterized protein ACBT57_004520 isoform 1-T1 [Dama dama]
MEHGPLRRQAAPLPVLETPAWLSEHRRGAGPKGSLRVSPPLRAQGPGTRRRKGGDGPQRTRGRGRYQSWAVTPISTSCWSLGDRRKFHPGRAGRSATVPAQSIPRGPTQFVLRGGLQIEFLKLGHTGLTGLFKPAGDGRPTSALELSVCRGVVNLEFIPTLWPEAQ